MVDLYTTRLRPVLPTMLVLASQREGPGSRHGDFKWKTQRPCGQARRLSSLNRSQQGHTEAGTGMEPRR